MLECPKAAGPANTKPWKFHRFGQVAIDQRAATSRDARFVIGHFCQWKAESSRLLLNPELYRRQQQTYYRVMPTSHLSYCGCPEMHVMSCDGVKILIDHINLFFEERWSGPSTPVVG